MHRTTVSHVVATACAILGIWFAPAIAADDYPVRPVTIVVPFPPGASTDILGRYDAEVLQRELHESFVVENRPGAASAIGTAYVARAAADGYTLLHAPTSLILVPHLMKAVPYNPLVDFDPIVLVGITEFTLVISPALGVNSVAELIALAKSKPGVLTYASAGNGSPHHLFAELFKTTAKIDIRHIPYKGTVPGLLDVAGGAVSMMFADLAPALPLIQGGKVKLIAVTSAARSKTVPDIPALSETVPGYDASGWQGLFARAGTPKPIIEKISAALLADLKRPEIAERFRPLGIAVRGEGPEKFRAFLAAESAKWGRVVREAGIEPQ